MAEGIAINVAAEAVESLSSRTWREIQYIFNYNDNLKKLTEKVKSLEDKEGAIKLQVDAAERNAEIIGPDVLEWLKKVDNIKKEANEVLEHKQALMKTGEVIKLQDASKFERIGYPTPPGQMPFASPQEFDGFESRMKIPDNVMQALKDDSITIIGICGMAGIGKMTLAKEIADKVKVENLFDEVAMAVVSHDPSIANIQDNLRKISD